MINTLKKPRNVLNLRPVPKVTAHVKGRAMTIAAGFRCSDGVVLCADTEIALGTNRTYQSKIFIVSIPLGCYLTYCGSTDFAKELVEELKHKLSGLARTDSAEALTRIKDTYRQFVKDYWLPDDQTTWTSILVTLREGNRVNLYTGRQQQFPLEPAYATLGIGQDQAESLFHPLYHDWMSTEEAVYMGIYALRVVKKFVVGCGGNTEYVEIFDDPNTISFANLTRPSEKEIEDDFEFFDSRLRTLLLAFPNVSVDVDKFQKLLTETQTALIQYRKDRFKLYEENLKKWNR